MSCHAESPSGSKASGCACGGSKPFPWLSAIGDPVIRRLFLQRYGLDLMLGASAGLLAGLGALAAGEVLGGLGPLLNGPWLHLHPAVVLPATFMGGLCLAVDGTRQAATWRSATGWLLVWALLGGSVTGWAVLERFRPDPSRKDLRPSSCSEE